MKTITFVVFGGTGSLMRLKLAGAISRIAEENKDIKYNIIGIGRTPFSNKTYKEMLLKSESRPKFGKNVDVRYYNGDVTKPESFVAFEHLLKSVENEPLGRIFYLATSYDFYEDIGKIISKYKLKDAFTRIMIEKPFGRDHDSSLKINSALSKYFEEEQIFRVDHYLAKETVDNILLMRFSNPLFENIWNSNFIDKIKIFVKENVGVHNRIDYYEKAGAIRDMIQNHILQVLLFILMDAPRALDSKSITKEKMKAIKKLSFKGELLTGQYEGYKEEAKSINPDSDTETYAEVRLTSSSKRWRRTKIILVTGKNMKEKDAHITLEYKKEPCLLYCSFDTAPNKLIFRIQPSNNVEMTMNAKVPGKIPSIEKVRMTFSPSDKYGANTVSAYEIILKECIKGDKNLFINNNILNHSWILTDKIIKKAKTMKPRIYKKGSDLLPWN